MSILLKKVVTEDDCIFWTGRRFGKVDLIDRVTDRVSVGKAVCNDLSRLKTWTPEFQTAKIKRRLIAEDLP